MTADTDVSITITCDIEAPAVGDTLTFTTSIPVDEIGGYLSPNAFMLLENVAAMLVHVY